MLHLSSLHFAALFGFSFPSYLIAVIVPLAGLIFGGAIAISAMYFSHQRQRLWHETARLALEKGQPLPPSPPDMRDWHSRPPDQARNPRWRGLTTGGLINLAVGAGLFFALRQISRPTAYFAAIPGFIGVALLLSAVIDGIFSRGSDR